MRITANARRRAVLRAIGTGASAGLAGCSGLLEAQPENDSDEDRWSNSEDDPIHDSLSREALADSPTFRTYQYDPAHTGDVDVSGPVEGTERAWDFGAVHAVAKSWTQTPAADDGTIYVAEGNDPADAAATTGVYALDAATGAVQWHHETTGSSAFAATALVNDIVVQPLGKSVLGLDAATGDERWSLDLDFRSRVVATDDRAFLLQETTMEYELVALDPDDGSVRWDEPIVGNSAPTPTAPAVANGVAYVAGRELTALSAADGDERWSARLAAEPTDAPTVRDGVAYVLQKDETVAAYDAGDGSHLWTAPVGGTGYWMLGSPAVSDGTLYVPNSEALVALDVGNGEKQWSSPTAAVGPPVVDDDTVYLNGIDKLSAHDAASGEQRWTYTAHEAAGVRTAPVVLDGMVLFANRGLDAVVEK